MTDIDDVTAKAIPASVPEGFKLVPVEPTHEMLVAGCKALGALYGQYGASEAYRSMIASAPTPPVSEDRKCKCTLAQSLVGDGCDICNPELAAELREEQAAEDRKDAERYSKLVVYLIGDRTDLDDAIVAAASKDEMSAILDAMQEDKP